MKKTTILILLLAAAFAAGPLAALPPEAESEGSPPAAQAEAPKPAPVFGLSLSGFIKTDLFYDSRQTVSLREGHFLILPAGELPDRDGKDLNARASFNILSVQTRLVGKVTGPDALGAKTSGLVEAEFFGTSDADINGFRLRHAFVKLNWRKTELLVGQYWHAMFITESFPDVVSFNTGAPFQPFSRNPQVRLTHALGKFSLVATAMTQRDFTSPGPQGASSVYLRNAILPELNLKLHWAGRDAASGNELLFGGGGDYKTIAPRTRTDTGYKADESLGSWSGMAYAKLRTADATFKVEGVYGRNLYNLTMLGGYAVSKNSGPPEDDQEYANLNTMSVWGEVHTNGARWQAGLFGGWSKNLGLEDERAGAYYARGSDIGYVYRIAPRLVFNEGKFRFATEIEWTAAGFGTPDAKGVVEDIKEVGNLRLLVATYYFF